jgi:hypothetical protein
MGLMEIYTVVYRGKGHRYFNTRDKALAFIMEGVKSGAEFDDYEILDRSDVS